MAKRIRTTATTGRQVKASNWDELKALAVKLSAQKPGLYIRGTADFGDAMLWLSTSLNFRDAQAGAWYARNGKLHEYSAAMQQRHQEWADKSGLSD